MRFLVGAVTVFALAVAPLEAADTAADAQIVKATRKKLETKVNLDFKDTKLSEVVDELKKQVEGLSIKIDSVGGVSQNMTITYKCTDKPLDVALDEMFKLNDLGYVIGRKKDGRYAGWVIIKKGKYRGDEEEATTPAKTTEKPAEVTKPEVKPEVKPLTKPETKPAESADTAEQDAARKLRLAKMMANDGLTDKAKTRYQDIVKSYPNTKAAQEAKELLEKLKK